MNNESNTNFKNNINNFFRDNTLTIELNEGEFVPNLMFNPKGYEAIVVKTLGNKKLEKKDYDN